MLKMSETQSKPQQMVQVDYSEDYDVVYVRAEEGQLIFDPTKQTPRAITSQIQEHLRKTPFDTGLHRTSEAIDDANTLQWKQWRWWDKLGPKEEGK